MPRKSKGARLWLDKERGHWVIRDGTSFIRTGCVEADNEGAEKRLADYIAEKYEPAAVPSPLIADVLLVYAKEKLPKTRAAEKAAHNISNLTPFWATKRADNVNASTCEEYAKTRPQAAARRDLEVLRAALYYWHEHKAQLAKAPLVILPEKSGPRERWLTEEEAHRLRKAAMKWPHLYRFVILGLKTGSRSGVLLSLKWSQINLRSGVMDRMATGETEAANKRKPPVRLGKSVVRLLRRWKVKDGKIQHVIHFDGKPVKSLKKSWALACEAAKLEDASPHTMRHTRATWLMQAGIDLWEAAGHLGMSVKVLENTYGKHHPDFQSGASEV
ncbi:site-specific integrase [Bradyrhizobium sp. 87]|uniref:site-specific integrase n=1 Tax=Bradyrhizobium sp. 87 TaxID=2782682 RepID=UPI001FF85617|nr:site-specific integrase [Bradyrhizobium sp. 87]MCK1430860.1 site-specific integrase [Bradyrhizobium sp. 87]